MPVASAFHDRTHALCASLSYREWSGYYAVSSYETHHEHEYHAIRHAAALIDVSPLYKYRVSGPDATRLVDRVITRDASRMSVGQVYYTPWCDEDGAVIDDGTVTRVEEDVYRWTAAEPNLRWFTRNAAGLRVDVTDMSGEVAALAVQGPTSAAVLRDAGADIDRLRYFRAAAFRLGDVDVDISRTGYTGDLGYEIWMPWARAVDVWDLLMARGHAHGLRPAGMLALDVARVEAGLLLIDVDFHGRLTARTPRQRYSPFEMGLGRLVDMDKSAFVGRAALAAERACGWTRQVVGLDVDWPAVERLHEAVGLPPEAPTATSRTAVPVYAGRRQAGRATSTTWSPVLKGLIALATIDAPDFASGSRVQIEVTVEAVRHRVPARVVETPFFNPARKTALPPA